MSTDTGGPAFPGGSSFVMGVTESSRPIRVDTGGVTLLDWFAGQALMAMGEIDVEPCEAEDEWFDDLADASYRCARAMLAEKRRREAKEP